MSFRTNDRLPDSVLQSLRLASTERRTVRDDSCRLNRPPTSVSHSMFYDRISFSVFPAINPRCTKVIYSTMFT